MDKLEEISSRLLTSARLQKVRAIFETGIEENCINVSQANLCLRIIALMRIFH